MVQIRQDIKPASGVDPASLPESAVSTGQNGVNTAPSGSATSPPQTQQPSGSASETVDAGFDVPQFQGDAGEIPSQPKPPASDTLPLPNPNDPRQIEIFQNAQKALAALKTSKPEPYQETVEILAAPLIDSTETVEEEVREKRREEQREGKGEKGAEKAKISSRALSDAQLWRYKQEVLQKLKERYTEKKSQQKSETERKFFSETQDAYRQIVKEESNLKRRAMAKLHDVVQDTKNNFKNLVKQKALSPEEQKKLMEQKQEYADLENDLSRLNSDQELVPQKNTKEQLAIRKEKLKAQLGQDGKDEKGVEKSVSEEKEVACAETLEEPETDFDPKKELSEQPEQQIYKPTKADIESCFAQIAAQRAAKNAAALLGECDPDDAMSAYLCETLYDGEKSSDEKRAGVNAIWMRFGTGGKTALYESAAVVRQLKQRAEEEAQKKGQSKIAGNLRGIKNHTLTAEGYELRTQKSENFDLAQEIPQDDPNRFARGAMGMLDRLVAARGPEQATYGDRYHSAEERNAEREAAKEGKYLPMRYIVSGTGVC